MFNFPCNKVQQPALYSVRSNLLLLTVEQLQAYLSDFVHY